MSWFLSRRRSALCVPRPGAFSAVQWLWEKDQAGEHKLILLTSKIALLTQRGIKSWPRNEQLIPLYMYLRVISCLHWGTGQSPEQDNYSGLVPETSLMHAVARTTTVSPPPPALSGGQAEQNGNVMTPKMQSAPDQQSIHLRLWRFNFLRAWVW